MSEQEESIPKYPTKVYAVYQSILASYPSILQYKIATGINKYIGLMFKLHPKPLMFVFEKETMQPIHSFFCKGFVVTWYDKEGMKIESRTVKPFYWDIKPSRPYLFLTEEPL